MEKNTLIWKKSYQIFTVTIIFVKTILLLYIRFYLLWFWNVGSSFLIIFSNLEVSANVWYCFFAMSVCAFNTFMLMQLTPLKSSQFVCLTQVEVCFVWFCYCFNFITNSHFYDKFVLNRNGLSDDKAAFSLKRNIIL